MLIVKRPQSYNQYYMIFKFYIKRKCRVRSVNQQRGSLQPHLVRSVVMVRACIWDIYRSMNMVHFSKLKKKYIIDIKKKRSDGADGFEIVIV